MKTLPLTVLVAVKNEAVNLERCLASLTWAQKVIVVDSNSCDNSAELAARMGAQVIQFQYRGGYPKKRQWALEQQLIDTPWALLLDADESIPQPLYDEIAAVIDDGRARDAYFILKGFHFLGRRFRYGGFSHSAILLFRTGKARFERLIADSADGLDMEVHERLIVDGTIGALKTPLIHQDDKGLAAYIRRHNEYSTWEARVRMQLFDDGGSSRETIPASLIGNLQERRRFLKKVAMRVPAEPFLWFVYHYVFRLGILEGRPGLIASQLRAHYISEVRAKVYELRSTANRQSDCGAPHPS
jgi:glycosyltransferase involved in cell wall biosynthesis